MSSMKIPESWAKCTLKDVCSVITDGTHQTPTYSDSGVIFLSSKNVTSRKIDWDNTKFISEKLHRELSARVAPRLGDVLLAKNGTTGVAALVDRDLVFDIYVSLALLRPTEVIFPKYLLWIINSPKSKNQFNKRLKGVGVPNLHLKEIREVEIGLPPHAEQKRIVAKIESTHEKIKAIEDSVTKAEELIEKYREALLQKAFRGELIKQDPNDEPASKLLERIRSERAQASDSKKKKKDDLPPIKPEETPFEIPKSWKWVVLGNVAFVTKLAGFEYTKHFDLKDFGEVPVIRAQNVRKGYLDLTNLKYIPLKVSKLLDRCALTKRSIVMTFIGANIGDTTIIDPKERYHLAPNVAKIEPNEVFHLEYLMHYLLSSDGRSQVFKSMKSTAQPSLSMTTIREVFIPLPPKDEQIRIASSLKKSFDSLTAISEFSSHIQSVKAELQNSILAAAFGGRLVEQVSEEGTGHDLLEKVKSEQSSTDAKATEKKATIPAKKKRAKK